MCVGRRFSVGDVWSAKSSRIVVRAATMSRAEPASGTRLPAVETSSRSRRDEQARLRQTKKRRNPGFSRPRARKKRRVGATIQKPMQQAQRAPLGTETMNRSLDASASQPSMKNEPPSRRHTRSTATARSAGRDPARQPSHNDVPDSVQALASSDRLVSQSGTMPSISVRPRARLPRRCVERRNGGRRSLP